MEKIRRILYIDIIVIFILGLIATEYFKLDLFICTIILILLCGVSMCGIESILHRVFNKYEQTNSTIDIETIMEESYKGGLLDSIKVLEKDEEAKSILDTKIGLEKDNGEQYTEDVGTYFKSILQKKID